MILGEIDIRFSTSFLGAVVFPEQVRLELFLEGGETVSVSDGGGELIPPLGGQTGEELVRRTFFPLPHLTFLPKALMRPQKHPPPFFFTFCVGADL